MKDLQYYKLLSEQYPTIETVSSKIVSMTATLCLPKGTEYFFSDLHGEHEAFIHLLRSGSGVIREKIETLFSHSILESDRAELAALICYPKPMLVNKRNSCPRFNEWSELTIGRLVLVCRDVSAKYTRSRVHKAMDPNYAYIMDELLQTYDSDPDKRRYFRALIASIVKSDSSDPLIIALCHLIQQMTVDHLHIIGDIFDRGPRADKIIKELMKYHDVDIQWGNHDINWMGAMSGNRVCLFNVLKIAISYNSFDVLEDGYGVNLRPLSMFAAETYQNDPCERFQPHVLDENKYDPVDPQLAAKMHKAVAIILFKLEGQLIKRHPEYHMSGRLLLDKVNFEKGTITLDGKEYQMLDTNFPTVDPTDPYKLTEAEEALVENTLASFRHSAKLRRHIDYIYTHGAMYKVSNNNLLYHGCIPMTESGKFDKLVLPSGAYSGKALLDYLDSCVRKAYYTGDENCVDLMWYLWCGAKSPVFGKDRMTTFERCFIGDKTLQSEPMNPYYHNYDDPKQSEKIMREFGLDPAKSHIVNGHVPVKNGENPVKAGGRLFVIDGGISKAYQSKTGIAGYTLIYNSHDIELAEHMPFRPADENHPLAEMTSTVHIVERMPRRMTVADTDAGEIYREKIEDLEKLLELYRDGTLGEKLED